MNASKLKNTAINALIFLVSLIIFMLIGEFVARIILSNNHMQKRILQKSSYEDIVYEYKPDITYFNNIHNADVTFNHSGFRDYNFSTDKPEGKIRIICLGDSATYGFGIADVKNTYPKRLETLLNETKPDTFEVYNFGVEGYNTHHELGVLEHKVLKYSPDIVFLGLNFGDSGYDWITVKNGFVINNCPYPPVLRKILPGAVSDFLMNNSVVFYHFELFLSKSFYSDEQKNSYKNQIYSSVRHENISANDGFDLELLLKMKAFCDKHNVKFIIGIMPWFSEPIDKNSAEMQKKEKLEKLLKENNVDYVDLFNPVLYENSNSKLDSRSYTETLKVSQNDSHPNEKALNVYAKAIRDKIISEL